MAHVPSVSDNRMQPRREPKAKRSMKDPLADQGSAPHQQNRKGPVRQDTVTLSSEATAYLKAARNQKG